MKPGKYVGVAFTPEQEKARSMSRRALQLRVKLADALMTTPDTMTRETWHKRLDWYLDRIERLQNDAKAIFPDVDESFVISSMTLTMPERNQL